MLVKYIPSSIREQYPLLERLLGLISTDWEYTETNYLNVDNGLFSFLKGYKNTRLGLQIHNTFVDDKTITEPNPIQLDVNKTNYYNLYWTGFNTTFNPSTKKLKLFKNNQVVLDTYAEKCIQDEILYLGTSFSLDTDFDYLNIDNHLLYKDDIVELPRYYESSDKILIDCPDDYTLSYIIDNNQVDLVVKESGMLRLSLPYKLPKNATLLNTDGTFESPIIDYGFPSVSNTGIALKHYHKTLAPIGDDIIFTLDNINEYSSNIDYLDCILSVNASG